MFALLFLRDLATKITFAVAQKNFASQNSQNKATWNLQEQILQLISPSMNLKVSAEITRWQDL